jgi:hypothetical protein
MKNELISKLMEKPKIKTTWWAMGLGLTTLLIGPIIGVVTSIIRPMIDPVSVNKENTGIAVGFSGGVFGLILSIATLVAWFHAYKAGERSWILWVGFVPAILVGAFWIFMLVGEFLFPH